MQNLFKKLIKREFVGIIIFFLFAAMLLTITTAAAGTTYYMRADGSAANKAAATSCSSASTAMSVATHNATTFVAGDIINLCDDGGEYTAAITLPSSGTSGNIITYQSATGDTPIIRGDNTQITGTWINTIGNEYSVTWTTEPTEVYKSDSQLIGGVISYNAASWTASGSEWFHSSPCKWNPSYVIEAPTGTPVYYTDNQGGKGSLSANEFDCDYTGTRNLYIKTSGVNPSAQPSGYIKASVTKAGELPAGSYFWNASTEKIHVRLADDSNPNSLPSPLTVSDTANCFNGTNVSYIKIKGITCKKTTEDGIKIEYTSNGGNITLNDLKIQNTGYSGIFVDGNDGLTISNIIITDSVIQYWVRAEHYKFSRQTREMGAITLGTNYYPLSIWSGTESFSSPSVQRNLLDYGDKYISQARYDIETGSGDKTTLYIQIPTNFTVTDNKVINGDHQIYIRGIDGNCGVSKIARNYVSGGYDDNAWISGCALNATTDLLVYANIFNGTGDDNLDIDGNMYITNNTLINDDGANAYAEGSGISGAGGATIINNLIYFKESPNNHIKTGAGCSGGNDHCFISLNNITGSTINNNIYWYDGTDTVKSFYDNVNLSSGGTFAAWRALGAAPDADSFYLINPELSLTEFHTNKRSTARYNANTDACNYIDGVLTRDSTWIVGQTVATINPCDPAIEQRLDIGAIDIPNYLEGE